MKAELNIFPENEVAFISIYDKKYYAHINTIMLHYSPDIEDIELQILFHGYKILKKNSVSSVDSYLEVFILESI